MTDRALRSLSLGWAVLTAGLLLMPGALVEDIPVPSVLETALELGAHFVLFGVLAGLAARAFCRRSSPAGQRARVLGLLAAYCVLLEIVQIAVPGRGFELIDILVGWLAIWLGFAQARWQSG